MPLDPIPHDIEESAPVLSGHGAKLAKLTIELTDIIARETDLLKKRLPREAQSLHAAKSRLMAEYTATLNNLKVNEKLLGPSDSPARKYLRKLTDLLRETLRDHARIILRLKAVAEGIIKSVGEEVVKKNRPVMAYGRNASYQPLKGARPTSLQINQVI
ncbi:hypothetical protein [Kordiimonas pumila]|uniref:Flagellar protein FlgN n=1 Tax=Kordiimonas pumila TaxID=2161677 RepID=A0ABV7D2I6_9PROT|nr:hypothetical protein [Kordiimonas pumila]